jgi:glycosyltransferase involved in cell wall biosynthesis
MIDGSRGAADSPVRVSVIVTTRDRHQALRRVLDALAAQDVNHDSYEVVVVDDGSRDSTPAMLAADTDSRFRVVRHETAGGPGFARNAGAAVGVGEWLAFTEDDVVIDRSWLGRALPHLDDASVGMVEGPTVDAGTSRPLRHRESDPVPSFIPTNLFVRRAVFRDLGGYDADFFDHDRNLYFREDADFGFRALEAGVGHRVVDDVVVGHPAQFGRAAACYRHARRYEFDPLLYRRHPHLYRRLIEVKQFGRLRVHRPSHLGALGALGGWFALAVGVTLGNWPLAITGLALAAVGTFAFALRYRAGLTGVALAWRVAVLAPLPLVYLSAVVRGCVRHRSVGVLW